MCKGVCKRVCQTCVCMCSGKAADVIAYGYKLHHDTHSHNFNEITLRKLVREELSRKQTDEEVSSLPAE